MNETQIQRKITRILKKRGYFIIRLRAVTPSGIPDLLVISPSKKVTFIEVKALTGKLSELQKYTHGVLQAYGQRVLVLNDFNQLDL